MTDAIVKISLVDGDFVIGREEIRYAKQLLRVANITGIKYGIEKRFVNGILTYQSYAVWLQDEQSTMHVEFAFDAGISDADIENRYRQTLAGLAETVERHIVSRMLADFRCGNGLVVGDLLFNVRGIHRQQPPSLLVRLWMTVMRLMPSSQSGSSRANRYEHLLWSEFWGYSLVDGMIMFWRKRTDMAEPAKGRFPWDGLDLRKVWNAVCLISLLEQLNSSGELHSLGLVNAFIAAHTPKN